jgi:hypothetical protein
MGLAVSIIDRFRDLADIQWPGGGPQDGQVFAYDATNDRMIPVTLTGGGGSAVTTFLALSDVASTPPTDGQYWAWNAATSKLIPVSPATPLSPHGGGPLSKLLFKGAGGGNIFYNPDTDTVEVTIGQAGHTIAAAGVVQTRRNKLNFGSDFIVQDDGSTLDQQTIRLKPFAVTGLPFIDAKAVWGFLGDGTNEFHRFRAMIDDLNTVLKDQTTGRADIEVYFGNGRFAQWWPRAHTVGTQNFLANQPFKIDDPSGFLPTDTVEVALERQVMVPAFGPVTIPTGASGQTVDIPLDGPGNFVHGSQVTYRQMQAKAPYTVTVNYTSTDGPDANGLYWLRGCSVTGTTPRRVYRGNMLRDAKIATATYSQITSVAGSPALLVSGGWTGGVTGGNVMAAGAVVRRKFDTDLDTKNAMHILTASGVHFSGPAIWDMTNPLAEFPMDQMSGPGQAADFLRVAGEEGAHLQLGVTAVKGAQWIDLDPAAQPNLLNNMVGSPNALDVLDAVKLASDRVIAYDNNTAGERCRADTWFATRLADNLCAGTTIAFTAAAGTDVFTTASPHGFVDGDEITLFGPSLPGGFTPSQMTIYYVRDSTSTTFKLSTSSGGSVKDVTSDGSGTVTAAAVVSVFKDDYLVDPNPASTVAPLSGVMPAGNTWPATGSVVAWTMPAGMAASLPDAGWLLVTDGATRVPVAYQGRDAINNKIFKVSTPRDRHVTGTVGTGATVESVVLLQIGNPNTLNRLIRSSFEADLSGWTSNATTFARQNGWASDGQWSARCTRTVTSNDMSLFSPSVACVPGDTIAASIDINLLVAASGTAPHLVVQWWNGSTWVDGPTIASGSWTLGKQDFEGLSTAAPAGTTMARLRLVASTVGSETIDWYADAALIAVNEDNVPPYPSVVGTEIFAARNKGIVSSNPVYGNLERGLCGTPVAAHFDWDIVYLVPPPGRVMLRSQVLGGPYASQAPTPSGAKLTIAAGTTDTTLVFDDLSGYEPRGLIRLGPGYNEVQQVDITGATAGTFTLTFNGQTTTGIARNASNNTIKTALEALSSIGAGNVLVSGGTLPGTPIQVTFQGTLALADQPQMTADFSGLTGAASPSVTTIQPGGPLGELITYGWRDERHLYDVRRARRGTNAQAHAVNELAATQRITAVLRTALTSVSTQVALRRGAQIARRAGPGYIDVADANGLFERINYSAIATSQSATVASSSSPTAGTVTSLIEWDATTVTLTANAASAAFLDPAVEGGDCEFRYADEVISYSAKVTNGDSTVTLTIRDRGVYGTPVRKAVDHVTGDKAIQAQALTISGRSQPGSDLGALQDHAVGATIVQADNAWAAKLTTVDDVTFSGITLRGARSDQWSRQYARDSAGSNSNVGAGPDPVWGGIGYRMNGIVAYRADRMRFDGFTFQDIESQGVVFEDCMEPVVMGCILDGTNFMGRGDPINHRGATHNALVALTVFRRARHANTTDTSGSTVGVPYHITFYGNHCEDMMMGGWTTHFAGEHHDFYFNSSIDSGLGLQWQMPSGKGIGNVLRGLTGQGVSVKHGGSDPLMFVLAHNYIEGCQSDAIIVTSLGNDPSMNFGGLRMHGLVIEGNIANGYLGNFVNVDPGFVSLNAPRWKGVTIRGNIGRKQAPSAANEGMRLINLDGAVVQGNHLSGLVTAYPGILAINCTSTRISGNYIEHSSLPTGAPAKLNWRGEWQPNTAYVSGDWITNANIAYYTTTGFTSGATFTATNWTKFSTGILAVGCTGMDIEGNTIPAATLGVALGATSYGRSSAVATSATRIRGNDVQGCALKFSMIAPANLPGGALPNKVFQDNITGESRSLAPVAGVLTLPWVGRVLEVTGNAAITSIVNLQPDDERTLIFRGTPALTASSTLRLPTSTVNATAESHMKVCSYDGVTAHCGSAVATVNA